jgi:hypothetical protein
MLRLALLKLSESFALFQHHLKAHPFPSASVLDISLLRCAIPKSQRPTATGSAPPSRTEEGQISLPAQLFLRLFQNRGHRLHHRSIGIVILQRPHISPSQPTRRLQIDVQHFEHRRPRIVIGIKRSGHRIV